LTGLCGCAHVSESLSAGPAIRGEFPVYNVKDFGAVADGATLNSTAIQAAVDVAASHGGGTVFFPPGDYLTGTVRLRDNVTLYLENGCTIWGSTKMSDYDENHKHLFYAEDAENVVLSGHGAIDGNGPRFWDNGRLQRWLRGEIDLPRTSDMMRFDGCTNVVLEDIDVRYGAFWNIGFGDCDRITVHAITMRNGVYEDDGPNTDGINLWNCTRVQISDCDIITGDDCIVVLGTSRDVTITNCTLQTSETALMISGVRNLSFSNSTIHDAGCGVGFRVWNDIHDAGCGVGFRVWNDPEKPEWGSAVRCWKVNHLEIDGFVGRQSNGSSKPAIWLKDVKGGAFIHHCRAPEGTGTFLKIDEGTQDVTIMEDR